MTDKSEDQSEDQNQADGSAEPQPEIQAEPTESQQPTEMNIKKGDSEYTPEDLKHLGDKEHVRLRPSMYIGDTGVRGLHHLVYEVVDNSIDEAMAGFATSVTVTINPDNSVTVVDDGRGIPVDRHPSLSEEAGRDVSTLEGVMTKLKFGGKFKKGAYQASGGLHGVGVTVVNFLSEWAEVEVFRDGRIHQQEYERGEPKGDISRGGATDKIGTKTTFKPDNQIFRVTKFSYETLRKRMQELAFLNRGVRIVIVDAANDESEEFLYERGIIEYVEHLNRASDALHAKVIYFNGEQEVPLKEKTEEDEEDATGMLGYELALQYSSELTESFHSYVNNINTHEGGTHVSGLRSALTRSLNAYAKKTNMFPKDMQVIGDDFREGLTVVLSLRVPEPQFEGQTKTKLGNSEIEGIINSALGEFLSSYLEENPSTAKAIIRKAMLAAEARMAAKKARDIVRKKTGIGSGALPGKLRDCLSKDAEKCELYLVEGDSAGGSAEGGRLRDYQAILPLRGKIINAYKSREDKVLANNEVQSMIRAIGIGIGEEQDLSKLRYHKIIIMTDADVDGSHIRTLLLCFFYRQMYSLVAGGYVYVAQPPLFRVKAKKKTQYVQTEEEMRQQLLERGLADSTFLDPEANQEITGEKMEELCRTLNNIEEDGLLPLERRGINLKTHSLRMDPKTGDLPVFHVFVGREEYWFRGRQELNAFLAEREKESGKKVAVSEEGEPGEVETETENLRVSELHEVRNINSGLKKLRKFNFEVEALYPQERTGIEDPRYILRRGDNETPLEDLRGLLSAVRAAGEKGLQVTRFKGLGEMNAEELRDTTLDPANRSLLKVQMTDVAKADELFRILMGEKVEPRREYIEKNAREVSNLDV